MNRSRIWTKSGTLVLECDEDGRLGWTPNLQGVLDTLVDLPPEHPVWAALNNMFAETALRLVAPHRDVFEQLTLEEVVRPESPLYRKQ